VPTTTAIDLAVRDKAEQTVDETTKTGTIFIENNWGFSGGHEHSLGKENINCGT
jgi:hypothetical protein